MKEGLTDNSHYNHSIPFSFIFSLLVWMVGGTGKDRAAKMMLLDAMATGKLPPRNGIVVEGTSGR